MKNVLEFIERSAEKYPDKLSVADINGGLTYKELEQTAKQIGAWFPELNRKLTEREYDELVDYAISIGVENGFIQEGETASESFIPPFTNEGI